MATFKAGAKYVGIDVDDIGYDIQPILITLAEQELRKVKDTLPTNREIISWLKENGAKFTQVYDTLYTITAY